MTTIAYHHESRTVAWDSRATGGGLIASDSDEKMIERNGVKFWLCGSLCDQDLTIDMYFGAKSNVVPECNAIVFDDGKFYFIGVNEDAIFWKQELKYSKCIGSGGGFAFSAIKLGLGAKESVEHAATIDCYTGGEIKCMSFN